MFDSWVADLLRKKLAREWELARERERELTWKWGLDLEWELVLD